MDGSIGNFAEYAQPQMHLVEEGVDVLGIQKVV